MPPQIEGILLDPWLGVTQVRILLRGGTLKGNYGIITKKALFALSKELNNLDILQNVSANY